MFWTFRRKVVAWSLVGLVAMGAECAGEEPKVPSTRAPQDRRPDPNLRRTVVIEAYSSLWPYEVIVTVNDNKGGNESSHEIVTGVDHYRQTVDYTSGTRLSIHVEVKPPKPKALGFCAVEDGPFNKTRTEIDDGWRARCDLTTAR